MFISEDVKYVGVNDTTIDLFEGQYKVPDGISYNSYVILDEKTAVMDTVDINFSAIWLEKVKTELGDRKPDYLVVQHMEPDHSASIAEFLKFYPDTTVVGNAKTFPMITRSTAATIIRFNTFFCFLFMVPSNLTDTYGKSRI